MDSFLNNPLLTGRSVASQLCNSRLVAYSEVTLGRDLNLGHIPMSRFSGSGGAHTAIALASGVDHIAQAN
jgi:hypothetical protein